MPTRVSLVLPSLRTGGAERVCVNIANELANRGYDTEIVLFSAQGDLIEDLQPGIGVVDLKLEHIRYGLLALVRYLRRARPSVCLVCMWPLTVMALWARFMARVPTRIVVAEHTTWSSSELVKRWSVGWQVRTSMHHSFPCADAIVTVSSGAADDLARFARLDRSSIRVIYNPVVGVIREHTRDRLEPAGWWEGLHKRVLAVGTLKASKDYRTLIEAFALLHRRLDARLLILGEGDCRDALEKQVRSAGLEGRVYMPGFVRDTAPYYEKADLHVLSSTSEGLPTVIIEALAAGTPVVSTDCPSGPREILVNGQFGQLVPVGDAQALGSAIADALSATHDSAGLKRRAYDFSIDCGVSKYEALLFPQKQNVD